MQTFIILSVIILQISCGSTKDFELTKSNQQTRSLDAKAVEKKDSILLQGFDKLSNSSKEKCLAEDGLELQVLELNEGSSDVVVFESLAELASSLKLGLGISGGGGWAFVNAAVGLDVEKTWKNKTRKTQMYALMSYEYIKEKRSLLNNEVELRQEMNDLLLEDPKSFRKKCGDDYVLEETLGANLYVLFKASSDVDFSAEELSFEGLLEVVVAGAGQGKINPRYEKTVERLMQNTDVSISCYHIGGQSDVCTAANLEDVEIYGEQDLFREKLAATKDLIAQDVKNDNLLGVTNRKFKNYPVSNGEKLFTKYYDYRKNQQNISDWEFMEGRIEKAVNGLPYFEVRYRQAVRDITEGIDRCTNMDNEDFDNCYAPNEYVYHDLLYAEDIGVVKLYGRDIFGQIITKMLNFTKLKSEPKKALKPEKFYSLKELAFDNEMEALQVQLSPGWTIIFFENTNATGSQCSFFNSSSTIYLSQNYPEFISKASAFMLVRDK